MTSPRILVVDDERQVANLYANWLREAYPVTIAMSGPQALEALDRTVDIVLLDRNMPIVTGEDVLSEIRTRDLNCRVALVTAIAPDYDIIELGFDEYLVKPVSRETLLATVERLDQRAAYSQKVGELYSLLEKWAMLRTEKPPEELAKNADFAKLEADIAALRCELRGDLGAIDHQDYRALIADLAPA